MVGGESNGKRKHGKAECVSQLRSPEQAGGFKANCAACEEVKRTCLEADDLIYEFAVVFLLVIYITGVDRSGEDSSQMKKEETGKDKRCKMQDAERVGLALVDEWTTDIGSASECRLDE